MQTGFLLPDDGLAPSRPGGPAARDRFTRLSVLALVIGLHAGVLALLLLARMVTLPNLPGQAAIEIALTPSPPTAPEKLDFKPLRAARINLPVVPPPEFTVASLAPSPIAVAVAASPVSSPAPGNGAAPSGGNDYLLRLHNHLGHYMIYPPFARRAKEQGVAEVALLIDKDHVVKAEISKSSGHDDLDREAVAMMYRANPVPPVPAGLGPVILTHIDIAFWMGNPPGVTR